MSTAARYVLIQHFMYRSDLGEHASYLVPHDRLTLPQLELLARVHGLSPPEDEVTPADMDDVERMCADEHSCQGGPVQLPPGACVVQICQLFY